MLKGFLQSRRWPIGLDIGTEGVKVLQMHRLGQTVSVVAAGQRHLARPAEGGAERRKAILEAIGEIMEAGRFQGRRVVSALAPNELHVKNVRMAPQSPAELVQSIRDEAVERFGFHVGSDQLRWINAGTVRQGTETREEIIMLAVPAETIEAHLDLLSEAHLVPEHIEAEPVALFRVFQHFLRRRADEDAVSVIAEIGRSGTRVTVARGRRIVFIKQIDIGGASFTEAVAKQLNLDGQEAYDLRVRIMKEQSGVAPRPSADAAEAERRDSIEWTLRDAMRGRVAELAREIALCLRYCSVTFRGLRPDRVVLTGGEAYDPALASLLAESLGVECAVGRPLRSVDVARMDVAANRRGTLAEWAVCAGLALRDIRFDNAASETDDAEHRLSA